MQSALYYNYFIFNIIIRNTGTKAVKLATARTLEVFPALFLSLILGTEA